jgi:hypothetical protein
MHKPKHSHTRGEWASQLPRRCTRWLIDLGCGMGMAPEILLQERHPRDWTFKSDAAPTAEAEGAAWVASQRALRFARALAAGFVVDGLCIAGLDGNAFFVEPLRKRTLEFAARGHPAVFIVPSVISAADGNATFLLDTKTSSKKCVCRPPLSGPEWSRPAPRTNLEPTETCTHPHTGRCCVLAQLLGFVALQKQARRA